MMSSATGDQRPLRVLIAMRGDEPAGWGVEAWRMTSRWRDPIVRVLAFLDGTSAPFTSLTPGARRLYARAQATRRREEEVRLQAILDEMAPILPGRVEVMRVLSFGRDRAAVIGHHAADWAADVVVVGTPARGVGSWRWPGPVHERVRRRVTCAVLILPGPVVAAGGTAHRLLRQRPLALRQRLATDTPGA